MSTCNLEECFLNADMDRLDHFQYFYTAFECCELSQFFCQFITHTKIFEGENKKLLNIFFERLISHQGHKGPYVRLKWLAFYHPILSNLPENSPLFAYSQKAFLYVKQAVQLEESSYGPYQKYLTKNILKPYLQYLSKLCILKSWDAENDDKLNQSPSGTKWYQKYNFLIYTCENLHKYLLEAKNFFLQTFPYLTKISLNIVSDLKRQLQYIKENYQKTSRTAKMSVLQIQEIQDKVHNFIWENSFQETQNQVPNQFIDTEVQGCSKEQITQFMSSASKPQKQQNYQTDVYTFHMH